MAAPKFRIGVAFPQNEIECDPIAIRDFVQAIEGLGFSHLVAADHVLGADTRSRPDWQELYSAKDPFHEPLVLFSFLARLTQKIAFMSGVVILTQRRTGLFGKQAANVDIFSNGRLQLDVGIGWNAIEYEALGIPFNKRGQRLDDQIRFLRRLWTEPTFSDD